MEGLETTYEYNPNDGTLLKETSPFGLETSYQYDDWQRLAETTNYLGNHTNTTYTKNNNQTTITTTADDGSSKISIYDALNRLIHVKEKDVLGQWVEKKYEYDALGQLFRESEPFTGSATQWNEKEYDRYGRAIKITSYTGKTTNISYNGLTTTVNDGTKTITTTKDAWGNIITKTDPGGTINYTYFGNGNLKSANYDGVIISIEQDGWGRKTKLTDPSAGVYTYEYNGFGEITKETTPKGETNYTYDATGKLIQKTINGDHTGMNIQYTHDPATKLLNSINLVNSDGNNSSYVYSYDSFNRPLSVVETTPYAIFTKTYTYNALGQVNTEEYAAQSLAPSKTSSKKIKNTYQNGGLLKITDFATNEVLWELDALNARGQVLTARVGNNMVKTNSYDTYGFLTQIESVKETSGVSVELMKLEFDFDAQRGNLNSRSNSLFNWNENFTYDNMDRLTGFNDNNGSNSHTYDGRGRITNNSQIGLYGYSGASYQQVSLSLNTAGENYYNNLDHQNITYNAFSAPVEIIEHGKDRVSFQYNAFGDRANMFYGGLETDKTQRRYSKHYSHDGSMEFTIDKQTNTTTFVTYIGGTAYNAPVIWHSKQGSSTSNNYYYLHRDYLGSILAITDAAGNFKEKRHFDAWGNIVKLKDGNGNALTKFVILDRGYTGHEHLLGVGIIHMNGRLYDPVLHRFLSPDNFVQNPFNTQNFNRYGYVLNNPLMYTDPNGEFLIFAIVTAAVVGAYFGGVAANDGNWNPTKWDWSSSKTWWGIAGGAVVGAASAGAGIAASMAVGTAISGTISGGILGGAITGIAGGATGGFISGAGMSLLPGGSGNFWQDGLRGAWMGAAAGGLLGGAIGGLTTPKGHNLWTGNPVRTQVSPVSELNSLGFKEGTNNLSKGKLYNGKITSDVKGNFQQAMKEWNTIQKQYGIKPSQKFPSGFKTILPDGTTVKGNFYYGGNTNTNGFTIKINTYLDKSLLPSIKKVPPVYIRYKPIKY